MPVILEAIIHFAVTLLITGSCIYLGAKLTREHIPLAGAIIIAVIGAVLSSLLAFFGFGFFRSLITLIVELLLLKKWSTIDHIWPSGVLILVVANVLCYLAFFVLIMVLATFGIFG